MTTYANRYAAPAPRNHHEPLRIAPDTYLIRQLLGEDQGAPMFFYGNSMVILGEEPIIVDTGLANNHREWLNDVFSLVDPEDVRYVFISHDDHDHVGNLPEVLDACRNATLISSWFQVERLSGDLSLPLDRMRWVNDGESFEAGGRTLVAVRPPIFDAPTARGLYDTRSGVYWAADAFATPVLQPTDDVAELSPEFWREMFAAANNMISPWTSFADKELYNKQVDRVAQLKPKVIAGGHTPPINAREIDKAIAMTRNFPGMPETPMPEQAVLEQALAAAGIHA